MKTCECEECDCTNLVNDGDDLCEGCEVGIHS